MNHFLVETLGVSEKVFAYVLLPGLIFLARIAEVSLNTIRIIYMLGGRRSIATMMGFFEAFIWLVAMRQIFQHADNWAAYAAYAGGFASGIFVGMIIEEEIAYGKVIVRIITRKDVNELIFFFNDHHYRYTKVETEGPDGHENLVFTVLERDQLDTLLNALKKIIPTAVYTIENVRLADENGNIRHPERVTLFTRLRGIIKN